VTIDETEIAAFIRTQTKTGAAAIVPEIALHLASEDTLLWHMAEDRLRRHSLPPPFWAFAWPGGQGLARYLLDPPDVVKGKRVLDFAAGGGIAAIAATKAGAQETNAAEIDPYAHVALTLNAKLNGVAIGAVAPDLTKPYKGADVIIAGDVCYDLAMSTRVLRWLYLCVAKGVRVILADPGRAYVPESGLAELARYDVPVARALEDFDRRTVTVWDVSLPEET
jgi:predicted nicotinamide N-methyase